MAAPLTPRYPEGTPEYDAYAKRLRELLSDPAEVAAWVASFPPVDGRQAGIGK